MGRWWTTAFERAGRPVGGVGRRSGFEDILKEDEILETGRQRKSVDLSADAEAERLADRLPTHGLE